MIVLATIACSGVPGDGASRLATPVPGASASKPAGGTPTVQVSPPVVLAKASATADSAPTSVSLAAATKPPTAAPPPTPQAAGQTPTKAYACPSGPCPRSLAYGVNGCSCAGQTYEESRVTALFCCASGFSGSECPESLESERQLEATFGSTQAEVESQLVTVGLAGVSIRVHKKAAAAFRQVDQNLRGVDYQIREPLGTFYWRPVAGHSVLSLHSFGIAVDVNPGTNPSCGVTRFCNCLNQLITDMPPEFVRAFTDAGFEWGGDWQDHPDPMHFEWAGWRQ